MRNYVVVLDTSGSMTESALLPSVYRSLEEVLKGAKKGDVLYLLTFDLDSKFVFKSEVQSQKEVDIFLSRVRKVTALGQWTNLIGALDHSIRKVVSLLKADSERENLILLYTDGVHHLPPWIRDGNRKDFDDLYLEYYQDGEFDQRKTQEQLPWFIYYVELDIGDTHLKRFLDQTESGKLISKKEFDPKISFISEPVEWNPRIFRLVGSLALFFVFIVVFLSRYKIVRREVQ